MAGVCHYPNGGSKWNPIEHWLFSHISMNWAGKPLRSFELMCAYIEGTTTSKGLTVRANLVRGSNELGERITEEEFWQLHLQRHSLCSQWNYTLRPRSLREVEARARAQLDVDHR
jgi:hypothetical protein